jgi:hypothetical protein
MKPYISPTFSLNEYDVDGDVNDTAIFLHFGDFRLKVAENMEQYQAFIDHLETIKTELSENYFQNNE